MHGILQRENTEQVEVYITRNLLLSGKTAEKVTYKPRPREQAEDIHGSGSGIFNLGSHTVSPPQRPFRAASTTEGSLPTPAFGSSTDHSDHGI